MLDSNNDFKNRISEKIELYYGILVTDLQVLKTGLIHQTYKICSNNQHYILQIINTKIFKSPLTIHSNLIHLGDHFNKKKVSFSFPKLIFTKDHKTLITYQEFVCRVFEEIPNTICVETCQNSSMAFEAGSLLGKFYFELRDFKTSYLKRTLPNFHNLDKINLQYINSVKKVPKDKLFEALECMIDLQKFSWIVKKYTSIKKDKLIKIRPTHHDTKISNFLFNGKDQAVAIIDFDTLMPGYFISDLGDMFRTYLPNIDERNIHISDLEIDTQKYQAIKEGFLTHAESIFTSTEIKLIPFAGYFMIYMQALRFLSDFLNNNVYYQVDYEFQNLDRAKNQCQLLQKYHQFIQYRKE